MLKPLKPMHLDSESPPESRAQSTKPTSPYYNKQACKPHLWNGECGARTHNARKHAVQRMSIPPTSALQAEIVVVSLNKRQRTAELNQGDSLRATPRTRTQGHKGMNKQLMDMRVPYCSSLIAWIGMTHPRNH